MSLDHEQDTNECKFSDLRINKNTIYCLRYTDEYMRIVFILQTSQNETKIILINIHHSFRV
jgi:hypothetical protein